MICDTLPLFWALSSVAPALRDALSLGNLYKSGLFHQLLGVPALHAYGPLMKKTGSVAAFSTFVAFSLVLDLSACSSESKQGHSPDTPAPENSATETSAWNDRFFSVSPENPASDFNDPFATYSFEDSATDSADDFADLAQEDDNRVETHNVGVVIKSPSANISVKKIESRKSIQGTYGRTIKKRKARNCGSWKSSGKTI